MTKYKNTFLFSLFLTITQLLAAQEKSNVIDKVIWVVGEEAIFLSEVEEERIGMLERGERIVGEPNCIIPEELAVRKLYLDQAKIDSIFVPKSSLTKEVQRRENELIRNNGSKERLEERWGKTMSQIREELYKGIENQQIVQQVQQSLTKDVKLTPSEVRKYYAQLPQDSLPYIETTVEVQILMNQPEIPLADLDIVKGKLRDYTNRINNGEDFSTLAIMYSEDGSAMNGGELGFATRSTYDPAFANTAFSLMDPKKVSNIVESEYGFHIIQLIERRGERANFRHILLKPKVPYSAIEKSSKKLQGIGDSIKTNIFTFEEAVFYLSSDKETRNNNGLMVNQIVGSSGYATSTSKFKMEELPTPIAKAIENMQVGEVSVPITYKNPSNQKDVVALVKLKSRTPGHIANVGDDYEELRQIVQFKKENEVLNKWVKKKIAETYVFIDPNWRDCTFKYGDWGSGTDKSGIQYAN